MISRSVPQTPSAIASTSSAPYEAGGSGTSHNSTEFGFGGRTVMARKGKPWEVSRPRVDSARREKFHRSPARPRESGDPAWDSGFPLRGMSEGGLRRAPPPDRPGAPSRHALDAENEQDVA